MDFVNNRFVQGKDYVNVFFKKYSFFLKLFLGVAILYFVFTQVNFLEVLQILNRVDFVDVIVLVLLNFMSFFIMVAKWQLLLKRYVKIGYSKLSSIYLASDYVNLFCFGTLGGEAYKILHSDNKKAVFMTSIFDRLYSFKAYFLISAFLFIVVFNQAFLVPVLVFMVFMSMLYYLYTPVIEYFRKYKVFKLIDYAKMSAVDLFQHNMLSLVYLITFAMRLWYSFYIFGYFINFYLLMIFSAVIVIAISAPISVQGLGVREWLFIQFAVFVMMPLEVAVAVSILIYITGLIYRLFGMIPFLSKHK